MDIDHRAQTLQALEAFIQTQKSILARQRADIDKLQRLKVDIVQRPTEVLKNLSNELNDNAFRISEQADCRLKLPKEIEWSAFEKADTGPLRTLAQTAKESIVSRTRPSLTQRSELSDLQRFVKQARAAIIDPILARFADMSPEPESDGDDGEPDPLELRRQLEQAKIRELKKRQIRVRGGGLSLPLSRQAGQLGVFVRQDVEEAAMDLDVSIDGDEDLDGRSGVPANAPARADDDMEVDASMPQAPVSGLDPTLPAMKKPPILASASRVRRPSKAKQNGLSHSHSISIPEEDAAFVTQPTSTPRPRTTKKVKLKLPSRKVTLRDDDEGTPSPEEGDDFRPLDSPAATNKKRTGTEKPKPETYKQAWTESEQNLLEQLLEEIPDGAKNRWQKISIAMGGRRTPRQVASRVQKYFEKLKKFGIGIGSAG